MTGALKIGHMLHACFFKMAALAAKRPSPSEWKAMKRRCVIVYGSMEGRMYFREDFMTGLQEISPGCMKDHVLSFGPLSRFLCCQTDVVKDLLLASGQLLVKKYVLRVRSADRDQFKARIHRTCRMR